MAKSVVEIFSHRENQNILNMRDQEEVGIIGNFITPLFDTFLNSSSVSLQTFQEAGLQRSLKVLVLSRAI